MAKVTFGGGVTGMRNKLGGSVFSRNGGGDFVRTWFVPPYRSTARTLAVRNDFKALTKAWATALTDDQRQQWRGQALTFYACVHGRPVGAVGGLQTFVAANMNLRSVGLPDIMEPTYDREVSVPGDVDVDAAALAAGQLIVSAAKPPAMGDAVRVWVTPPMSAGRKYVHSFLRLIQTFPPGTAGPYDVTAAYAARGFNPASAGSLGAGVEYVARASGQLSLLRTIRVLTGGPDMLKTSRVVLTDAQFKVLPTTPASLLGSAGPGKVRALMCFSIVARLIAGYTNFDVEPYLFAAYVGGKEAGPYVPNFVADSQTAFSDLFAAPGNNYFHSAAPYWFQSGAVWNDWGLGAQQGSALSAIENTAIELECSNGGLGNFTGGNAGNRIIVNLAYTDFDVS